MADHRQLLGRDLLTAATFVIAVIASNHEAFGQSIAIGKQKQMFLDNYIIQSTSGLEKVQHQAIRYGSNPVLSPDKGWEGIGAERPLVTRNSQGTYEMYYLAREGGYTSNPMYSCYATSPDGIAWTKPSLGLYEWPADLGNTENNIVLDTPYHGAWIRAVALNPLSTDPSTKYVARYTEESPYSHYSAYSPDRLEWTIAENFGDLRNAPATPGPTANPTFVALMQKWYWHNGRSKRAIWRAETADMQTWSGGSLVVTPSAGDSDDLEFYDAQTDFLGSENYGGLHIGYLYEFHTDPDGEILNGARMSGTIDTYLMYSRDTITWTRVDPDTPLLPLGASGEWDDSMVSVSSMIVDGDAMRFYYEGWDNQHSTLVPEHHCAVGMATMRLDGFLSLDPIASQGTMTTKLLTFEGDKLTVNSDVQPGGSIQVTLLNQSGQQIAVSDPITGDGVSQVVTFNSQWDLSQYAGMPVSLAFTVDDASLYSFAFVQAPEPATLIMLGQLGLILLAWVRQRRKKLDA